MSEWIKRTESICNEFDARTKDVGLAFARAEIAKRVAELEEDSRANQQTIEDLTERVKTMREALRKIICRYAPAGIKDIATKAYRESE